MLKFSSRFGIAGQIELPEYSDTRIQMMPVVLGDPTSVPLSEDWREAYAALCAMYPAHYGQVGYLTIDEGVVAAGASQRRGGMHVDAGTVDPAAPTLHSHGGGGGHSGGGGYNIPAPRSRGHAGGGGWHGGGGGWIPRPDEPPSKSTNIQPAHAPLTPPPGIHPRRKLDLQPLGTGMLTVSTVSGCKAWDQDFIGWPGKDGDCTHLAEQADEGRVLLPGEVAWLDTLCVHESIPLLANTRRQFVRLSMPSTAPWYDNSTPNPLGVMPTGPILPFESRVQ